MKTTKQIFLIFISVLIAPTLIPSAIMAAEFAPSGKAVSQAQAAFASSSEKKKPLRLARFDKPPLIDSQLDEEVWQRAGMLKDFYQTQPGDNTSPSQPTEILLGYDDRFLYIGIRATDEPGKVRATVAKRDDALNDDHVRIFLDTFNDKRRAYLLIFNPLGVQQDGIYTEGQEPDYSVDIVMESKGRVTDAGYCIEVAIPLKSLRYEAGEGKLWGLHAQRRIKRLNDEEDSWMPLIRGNTGFLRQAGQITGLENIAPERAFEIIPSLTISETGRRVPALPHDSLRANPALADSGRLVNQSVALDPGLTMKFGITSNITLDLAVNPDFAQVEADQTVVTANQRFPIFFEEKRPFFLEGIDIFQTPLRAVHTRTVIDPDLALKLSGKRGRNTFGLLMASDKAPGDFSEEERTDPLIRPGIEPFLDRNAHIGILRLKRDVGKESNLGLIATSYNFIEKHNQLAGLDGRIAINAQTTLAFQLLGATSRQYFYDANVDKENNRTGKGFGYFAQYQKGGRHLNYTLTGQGRTSDYRADVGFTIQTNINDWDFLARYNSEPKADAVLISWSLVHSTHARFDWQGRMKYSYQFPRLLLNFKRQTFLNLYGYTDYLRLFEEEFGARRTATQAGAFFGAPERRTVYKGILIDAGTTPSKKYSTAVSIDYAWNNFDYDFGAGPKFPRVSRAALADSQAPLDPGTGDALYLTASFTWQPTDALRSSLNYTRSRMVRDDTERLAYDQNIYSLRSTYQFTRFTFARARIDYDSLRANVRAQFLTGWTPNPGTSVYLGYNDDLNHNGFSPFTGRFEPGFRRNGRTFFIKMSYLLRRNL
jgi:hypothetical protein